MTAQTADSLAIPNREILGPFAVMILIIGGAPVAVKISYAEMSPFWLGLARFGLGALIFWALAIYKGLKVPKGRALFGAMLYGALGVGASFILMGWGLVATPASLAAILLALVPLMTIFLSSLQGIESLTSRGVIGSLLAVSGIVITVGGASTTDISLPHVGAIILGTAFLAESSVIIKRFPPNPPVMTNALAMTVGAVILAIASVFAGEVWTIPLMPGTWAAFVYLVVFVTIISFLLYLQVLEKWTASGTSYGFVMIPLVTAVLASMLSGEQITISFLSGGALVLAGVFVGALVPGTKKAAEVEECKDRAGQVLPRSI